MYGSLAFPLATVAALDLALISQLFFLFCGNEQVRRVVVLGTCVAPNDVGEPLRRCFTHELAVPPPSEALRLQLLQYYLWPRLELPPRVSTSSDFSSKSAYEGHRNDAAEDPHEADDDNHIDGIRHDRSVRERAREREALIAALPHIVQELVGRGARDVVALVADAQRRACLRSFSTSITSARSSSSPAAALFDLAFGRTSGRLPSSRSSSNSRDSKSGNNASNNSSNSSNIVTAVDLRAALKALPPPRDRAVASIKVPEVRWADVGGLAYVRHEIMAVLNLPRLHPELFASGAPTIKPSNGGVCRSTGGGGGVPRLRSAVLLFGPPGTGKTLVAKAVATECGYPFLSVKGPELLDVYVGESEKNVREVGKRSSERMKLKLCSAFPFSQSCPFRIHTLT